VVVHVDGGARGNPGPAAVAAVVSDPADPEGEALLERGLAIGVATNNVAEYRAVLLGLELAAELEAGEVEVVNDSELVARQIEGRYKVKHAGLKPLHAEAKRALARFGRWRIRSVPREANARADALVNETLDRAG
jgi:ribonuclease HI